MTTPDDASPLDRFFVRGSDGDDLYPSCVLSVTIDDLPPIHLTGKRVRLTLAASARRYTLDLDADNATSLASYVLRNPHDSYVPLTTRAHQERQELFAAAPAIY
jgi:hypothetical protein